MMSYLDEFDIDVVSLVEDEIENAGGVDRAAILLREEEES